MRIFMQEFPDLECGVDGEQESDSIFWSNDGRTVSYILNGQAVATVDLPSHD